MATGHTMKNVGYTICFYVPGVLRSVRDVYQALEDLSGNFIKWASTDEGNMGVYAIAGFPGVFGAVDGSHVRIIART